jgi:hypothetical protein
MGNLFLAIHDQTLGEHLLGIADESADNVSYRAPSKSDRTKEMHYGISHFGKL